jgi:hypothetical protein
VAWALVDDDYATLARFKWTLDRDGYAQASPRRGVKLRLHRVVLGLSKGDGFEADHRNGDPLDNRRENLRVVTRRQNGQNVPARRGHRGVGYDPSRPTAKCWRARIGGLQGAHIGWFLTEDEAAAAVRVWLAEHMPYAEQERLVATQGL